jgi:hypothetical protein
MTMTMISWLFKAYRTYYEHFSVALENIILVKRNEIN